MQLPCRPHEKLPEARYYRASCTIPGMTLVKGDRDYKCRAYCDTILLAKYSDLPPFLSMTALWLFQGKKRMAARNRGICWGYLSC